MVNQLETLFNELEWENAPHSSPVTNDAKWLNDLPLVLCGPLLRKVYYNQVSVWLAFKEEVTDITLHVFEAIDPATIAKGALRLTGKVGTPVKLGKNLFVTLITAISTDHVLKSDTIYGYKISFKHKGVEKQLGQVGVLKNGVRSISYAPYVYPTFCLPSDNINNLKIVHGSCRKPHGGRTDALRGLDTMLEINKDNVRERPQLLCLTGDQIYADDVSDMLLHRLMKTASILLGWTETLDKKYTAHQLKPGNRKDIIAKTGNKNSLARRIIPWVEANAAITTDDLTTTDARSHLIFLGEFIMMYLFTFSDVLMTAAEWPAIQQLQVLSADPREKSEQIARFNIEKSYLNSFVSSLRYVKRALANVSTLMIFDDHDITDDWFITKRWSEVALQKGTTSRRYIQNGMIAYAIFQDWGNDHTKYASGKGLLLLKALQQNNTQNYPNVSVNQVADKLLPKLFRDQKNKSFYLQSDFKWDYRIEYNSFSLLTLNTRTEREYYDKEAPVGNLVKEINTHGGFKSDKLLVLVSAAPVFGNLTMEKWQDQFRDGKEDVSTYFLSRIFSNNVGVFERDQEAWTFSGEGYKKLLNKISLANRVLILSGDVHYAYTCYVRLWKQLGGNMKLTEIVQSTSSALKNSTEKTHYPATDKLWLQPSTYGAYNRIRVMASKKKGEGYKDRDFTTFQDPNRYNPLITRIPYEGVKLDPDRMQFTIRFINAGGYNIMSPEFQKIRASEQGIAGRSYPNTAGIQPTVVGKDNISLLSFTPGSITSNIWFANGNYHKPDATEAYRTLFPFVKHTVNFNGKFVNSELPEEIIKKIFRDRLKPAFT